MLTAAAYCTYARTRDICDERNASCHCQKGTARTTHSLALSIRVWPRTIYFRHRCLIGNSVAANHSTAAHPHGLIHVKGSVKGIHTCATLASPKRGCIKARSPGWLPAHSHPVSDTRQSHAVLSLEP